MTSTPSHPALLQAKAAKKRSLQATARQAQHGLTLVELMVAMAISMFMLIAIALVYSSSKTGFVYANNTARMSEDASFAIDSLSRDIRMAAYGGCAGTVLYRTVGPDALLYTADDIIDNPNLQTTKSTPKLFNVSTLTTGTYTPPNPFDSLALSAATALKGYASTDTANRALLGTSTSYAISTTDPILYLSGGSAQALQVSAAVVPLPPATATNAATLGADPYNWSTPNNGTNTFMLIADCKGAEVFRIATMSSAGVIASESNFLNNYGTDAIITPLLSSTYFLATRSGATTKSLYRRYFNGLTATVEELVPNVEAITFQYGYNTTLDHITGEPNFSTDQYVKDSDAVFATLDWSRVVSVRMGLIMVTEDANQTVSTTQTLDWVGGTTANGNPYNVPTANNADRRLRRAYSTTISIRNRMGL